MTETIAAEDLAVLDPDILETVLYERSLADFAKAAWPAIEPMTPLQWNWHHDAICEHLEAVTAGEIRDLLVTIPPGFTKSSLLSILWPAWEWTSQPWTRWLTTSYGAELAVGFALKTRHLITSEWYQARWQRTFTLTGDQNVKSFYQNSASGFRIALGVGGAATGRKVDRVVCDDPHKIQRAGPKRVITHDFEGVDWWWTREASTRRNDPMKSARVVIMQRIHARDLAGRLIEYGGYEHLCLPAEFDAGRRARTSVIVNGKPWEDPRTEPGELLWPERFPQVFLDQEKRSQGSDYWALYQQKPSATGGTVFKRIWWRYWVPPGVERRPISVPTESGFELVEPEELPTVDVEVQENGQAAPETIFEKYSTPASPGKIRRQVVFDEQIQSWDLAFKGTESADFVSGQVWGRIGANAYLLDRRRRHLTFTETLAEVLSLSAAWPLAVLKLVEDTANGPAVIDSLQKKLGGLVAVKPQGGKEARAHAVTPLLESNNVYVPAPYVHPWVLEYLAEMDSFPRGEHDDDVDATTQALLRFLRSSSEWITIL